MEATFKINNQGSSKQQILIAAMKNQYLPVPVATNVLQSEYAPVQNLCALVTSAEDTIF